MIKSVTKRRKLQFLEDKAKSRGKTLLDFTSDFMVELLKEQNPKAKIPNKLQSIQGSDTALIHSEVVNLAQAYERTLRELQQIRDHAVISSATTSSLGNL